MKNEKKMAQISANTIKKVAVEAAGFFSFWGLFQAKVPVQLQKK